MSADDDDQLTNLFNNNNEWNVINEMKMFKGKSRTIIISTTMTV